MRLANGLMDWNEQRLELGNIDIRLKNIPILYIYRKY